MVSASAPPLLANVGVVEDVQAFGVSGHGAVLDPIVDHLHEVAGAGRPAVQIAVFGGAAHLLPPRRARAVAIPGARAAKIGSRRRTAAVVAADHQAVSAFHPPDSAAGAHVEILNTARPSSAARRISSW